MDKEEQLKIINSMVISQLCFIACVFLIIGLAGFLIYYIQNNHDKHN